MVGLFLLFLTVSANCLDIDWKSFTIDRLHDKIKEGESCESIIKAFLHRINTLEADPNLGGVISINPKALELARDLDERFSRTGRLVGGFHCVPILPKDNIDAAGLPSTSGIIALLDNIPDRSAKLVEQLEQAGAIVIAKANMSPMTYLSSKSDSETGGLAKNPYDLRRSTYGSSGGNGAAGAAMYGILGIGTDTSGSVVLPATAASLVGLRPTTHKLSTEGVLAGNHNQDTCGPMARHAEDIAAAMQIWDTSRSYLTSNVLDRDGLRGMRVAVLNMLTFASFSLQIPGLGTFTYETTGEARQLLQDAVDNLKTAGAVVSNFDELTMDKVKEPLMAMIMMNPKAGVCKDRWVSEYFSKMSGRRAFNNFEEFKNSSKLTSEASERYQKNFESRGNCDASIAEFISTQQTFREKVVDPVIKDADLVIYPTVNYFPELVEDAEENTITGVVLAAGSGYPSITVPIGFSSSNFDAPKGLPLGLTFLAKQNREDLLIKAAYSYQQQFADNRLPKVAELEMDMDGGETDEHETLAKKFVELSKSVVDFFQRVMKMIRS